MQLELDMSCHLLNVYSKFQIDISKHVEEKSGKRGRTDGQTDGRTLTRHNTSRFSKGRIKIISYNCLCVRVKMLVFLTVYHRLPHSWSSPQNYLQLPNPLILTYMLWSRQRFQWCLRHDDVIFCVTGPLCGEFTGHWWIPLTKASDGELWCFFFYLRLE